MQTASCVVFFTDKGRHWMNLAGVLCQVGQVHGGDDPGTSPHPQDVLAREQGGDAETSGLVLTDDVVTALRAQKRREGM